MAMNLATKYSDKVSERFVNKSLTDSGLNKEYDWSGVKTVTVYSIDTVPLNSYTRNGSNRYGTANDLGNTKQEMTLSEDKAFTFVIDKGNMTESVGTLEAGKCLAREIDEVIVPEIDKHRLTKWGEVAQTTGTAEAITKENAYAKLLIAQEKLDEAEIPSTGRILYCTPAFYSAIKLDPSFMLASDIGMEKRINGQVGEIDGVKVVKVPSTRMPENTAFILIHPSCSCSPLKLEDYKTHINPPGISGWLVEGRIIFDCFVLESRKKGVVCHKVSE